MISAPAAHVGGGSPQTRNVICRQRRHRQAARRQVGSNTVNGTQLSSPSGEGALVRGNYIGLNAAGTTAVPNDTASSLSVPNVRIGGTNAADRNIISGNSRGASKLRGHLQPRRRRAARWC